MGSQFWIFLPFICLPSSTQASIMAPQHRRRSKKRVRFNLGPRRAAAGPAPPRAPHIHDPRIKSSHDFQILAGKILDQTGRQIGSPTFMRRFQSTFAIPPHVVASAWNMMVVNGSLDDLGPRSFKPVHLLWALMWLKGYANESDNAARAGVCEKTFRKWSWFHVECLAHLTMQLIRWENRYKGDRGNRCLVTVDGTDFRTGDPVPRRAVWYSPKFKAAALRYELIVCIETGDIVGFVGPFAPKFAQDITIFRWKTKKMLDTGERALGDKGCRGDSKVCTPYKAKSKHHLHAMSKARARHETVNRRLKQCKVLRIGFRHHRSKHLVVFRAVAALTQLMFNHGYKPFQLTQLTYHDPMWLSHGDPA